MTDVHVLRRTDISQEKSEQAQRAVKAFRAFQPTLSAYARALTGKPNVRVEMHASSNGMTDGKVIYYRPPIEMGDNTPHVRRLCDKRDEFMQPRCKACAIREHVLVVIYHEIAHIAYGTFTETSDKDKAEAIQRAIREAGGKYAAEIEARVRNSAKTLTSSYLGLASIISPFLPVLVNALEDARVNSALFRTRRGTRVMFNADTQNIFSEGVEQKDPLTGEIVKIMWKDYALNAQVSVGVFCKAAGYDYSNWFDPVVVQALDDQELTDIIARLDGAKTASDSYELSFPVLARLRELGFCKSDTDPEEPEQDGQGDSEEKVSGTDPNSGDEGSSDSSGSSPDESSDPEADGHAPESGSELRDRPDESTGSVAEESEASPENDGDRNEHSDSDDATDSDETGESGQSDSDSGQAESEAGDEGDSDDTSAQEGQAADGQPERGGDSSGEDEQESSEGQGMGSPGAGQEGTGDVDEDSDHSGDPQGQSHYESSDSDKHREGSDEDDDRDETEASSEGGSSEGGPLDEDRDSEASGRAEHDSSLDQPEVPGEMESLGHDSESDRNANPSDDSERTEEHGSVDEVGPIDSGADKGLGGTKLEIPDDAFMGDADDAMGGLLHVEQHDDLPDHMKAEASRNDSAMEVAVIQGLYFETPSTTILGVRENRWDKPGKGMSGKINSWERSKAYMPSERIRRGIDGDFDPTENMLGPALQHMRVVFAENRRGKNAVHLKSGKVNGKVLGKRAPVHDPRLFRKRTQPGKRDYCVIIGMDISGSTVGENLVLEKKAVMAQATLCSRMGIKFAIYAHSGVGVRSLNYDESGMELDVYVVKTPEEPWSDEVKNRLRELGPYEVNLDGHALEYLRKAADKVVATDKIILYYSDGKMPAANHDEELEILQREIKTCAKKDITLLGVGIRTDSPARHGLDTVQVDDESDLIKVIRHLEKRLLQQ